ncbi:MAG TPA: sialidase family protein, partial [Ignavibacteriaceae bacterium]|nr:sialidase family protein [Ignavibacteriaceae bacterium]
MKRHLLIIVLLAIFAVWTMNSFAQNSDPRMWSIHFPKTGQFYDAPPGNLTWQNPNHKTMEYVFRDQVVDVLPNFRVHPSNASQSEVPITRGLDPNILFASANVFFSNNFFFSEGVYVSTDGGNNWFGSDTCTASPISDHGGDPGPGVGPDGRLYMSYLPGSYNSIKAAYSTDFGNTWSAGAILQSGSQDKNLTAVDNVPGSPYSGRAYVTWSDFTQSSPSVTVSYTTNGGVNWSAFQHVNTPAGSHYCQGVNPAVGPGGVVYIAYANPILGSPYTEDFVGLGKSTDGGATWTYVNNIYDENGIRGTLNFSGGSQIRVNGFPWMA